MNSTRREVLAALLGLPATAALGFQGCWRRVRPPGEIVGGDVTFGHTLREIPSPRATTGERVPVVIVGAGVAGLSAAWRLASAEAPPFVVLELEHSVGGTSRSGGNAVSPYPWGAHYVPAPMNNNLALIRLLREMGVVTGVDDKGAPVIADEHVVTEPEERVFYRGQWHEGLLPEAALTPDDRAQMVRFKQELARWVRWRDGRGRRAFALPMAHGSDDPEVAVLDGVSMAEWMDQRGLRSPRLRWYVDYACRDDYGCRLDTTSAWAGLFYFASRLEVSPGPSAPLLAWPEGNGRIIQFLSAVASRQIRVAQLAVDVVPHDDHVEVLAIDAPSGQMRALLADHVILAVPRFIAGRVLRPWRDQRPADLDEFETAPWVVANLWLSDRPANIGFVPAWDNVFYESPSLGYVTATHQRGRSFGPTVLSYYYALTDTDPKLARQKLLSATREEWVDVILADLGRAHPDIHTLVQRVDLYRWGHGMIRPRVGFVWGQARRRALRSPSPRVHHACTDLSGVALFEEAQYHGVRAAEAVLRAMRGPIQSWL